MTHSRDTAVLKTVNEIRGNLDSKKLSFLVLLDLSTAVETVDRTILLNTLRNLVGLLLSS